MDPQQAWQAAVGQLQMEMPKAAFDTWVRNTEFVQYLDGCFTVGVKNAYARDWLESRLSSTVIRMLTGFMNHPEKVEFVVRQNDPATGEGRAALPLAEARAEPRSEPRAAERAEIFEAPRPTNNTIHPRYTFDNFVVGPSNRLAHAACLAVAEQPARAYNPLFLYSSVGLGKTHLLHGIGNTCHANGLQVLYVSTEEFTNDLIQSIRTHDTAAFRERYRRIDVLLIDDIQFIAGKESTQEEFFHTFNTLHGQDKQIVISSDRPPKAMVTLEERLRSRFEWGLTADIQPPDLETRIAILRTKAERAGRRVPNEILESIARQITTNIRELEGALNRVVAYSDLSGLPLSMKLANTALVDMIPHPGEIEPQQVIKVVARVFGLTPERLLGRDRSKDVALPRQVAMYLLRQEGNASLPQIGEAMGGRDHTTVMYACEKISDLLERDDRLRRQVIQIREQLLGRARAAA